MDYLRKFEGMLFCTDLDGTLYNDEKTVSKQNLDAIEYFKSEGGLSTFITGRAPASAKEIYNAIKPNAPFGCFNGAGIYDGRADKYLWITCLQSYSYSKRINILNVKVKRFSVKKLVKICKILYFLFALLYNMW